MSVLIPACIETAGLTEKPTITVILDINYEIENLFYVLFSSLTIFVLMISVIA
jgi:hypothetical protein